MTTFFDSTPPDAYNVRTPGPARQVHCPWTTTCCATGRAETCSAGRRTRAWAGIRSASEERSFSFWHGGRHPPADGRPVALGYHTGHWEVGLLMEAAARELSELGAIPFAGFCHRSVRWPDPGHRRHVRQPRVSQRRGDGAPAAHPLAAHAARTRRCRDLRQGPSSHDDGARRVAPACRPCWCRAAVTLPAAGAEDAGAVQSLGARYAHGLVTLGEAAELT